ncbi:MAG TPA: DUF5597 domain-containing protein, partial [Sunxiuqinia sp.]|nr:DUF5597 domain-containing protein [Sunxiuqinia sp.]
SIEVCSPFSNELLEADTKAYTAMVSHLKEADADEQTVLMIQMQNEVGILGDSRDRSELADSAFHDNVPSELLDYLKANEDSLNPGLLKSWTKGGSKTMGDWQTIFGKGKSTDEFFMAWNYAHFMNHEAEAGKKIYALPVYVNAWLVQPEDKQPGDYPSGGPQAHMHDIWRAGAPATDLLAPDIYLPNFKEICARYQRNGNVLFVPETFAGEVGAANAFYAFGQANAIGYSPFGIDSRLSNSNDDPIFKSYHILSEMEPLILNGQSTDQIRGFALDAEHPSATAILGGYRLSIKIKQNREGTLLLKRAYGLVIALSNDVFFVAGKDFQITFLPATEQSHFAGIASMYEGKFVNRQWVPGRKLNGDAIMLNYHLDVEAANGRTGSVVRTQTDQPEILKLKLYQYE